MESYTAEFRAEVLAARDAGESTQEVALRFQVSKSWVRRIIQVRRESGQIAAKTERRKKTPKWHAWAEWLLAKVEARPDIYLRELKVELLSELGEEASLGLLCHVCRELERTRKKRRSSRPSKIGPTSSSAVNNGAPHKPTSTRTKPFSSTKPGRKRT